MICEDCPLPNPWKFWDHIYCINLKERTDRWQETLSEFRNVGLDNYERFEGIRYLNNGDAGCYMSHLSILEDAIGKKYNKILILEDDVKFLPDGIKSINQSYEELSCLNWDVFFLGFRTSAPIYRVSQALGLVTDATMTHAMGYCDQSIPRALNLLKKTIPTPGCIRPIDQSGIFSQFQSFNVFCSYPLCAIQRRSKSDVQQDNITDHEQDCINDYNNNFYLNKKAIGKLKIENDVRILFINNSSIIDRMNRKYDLKIKGDEILLDGQVFKKLNKYYQNHDMILDVFDV